MVLVAPVHFERSVQDLELELDLQGLDLDSDLQVPVHLN